MECVEKENVSEKKVSTGGDGANDNDSNMTHIAPLLAESSAALKEARQKLNKGKNAPSVEIRAKEIFTEKGKKTFSSSKRD